MGQTAMTLIMKTLKVNGWQWHICYYFNIDICYVFCLWTWFDSLVNYWRIIHTSTSIRGCSYCYFCELDWKSTCWIDFSHNATKKSRNFHFCHLQLFWSSCYAFCFFTYPKQEE